MDRHEDLAPLVVVCGVEGPHDIPNCVTGQNEIKLGSNIADERVGDAIAGCLQRLAQSNQRDQFNKARKIVNLEFCTSIKVPSRETRSVISPNHPNCTNPIFSLAWIDKCKYCNPTAVIQVLEEPKSGTEELVMIQNILHLKSKLEVINCSLIIVILESESNSLDLVELKHRVGFGTKHEMVAIKCDLPQDFDDQALSSFVFDAEQTFHYVIDYAHTVSVEYYANKMYRLREKRKALPSQYNIMLWDIRFTLKLAFCAQFKGDINSSTKIFESAYDSLSLVFTQGAFTAETEEYRNGRELMDVIAFRLIYSLSGNKTYAMFRLHLRTIAHIWSINNINQNYVESLTWSALQYIKFAQFCTVIDNSAISRYEMLLASPKSPASPSLSQGSQAAQFPVSHMPAGLLWLDAANYMTKASKAFNAELETGKHDTYKTDLPSGVDASSAFINSVSALSILPRAKAWALVCYGEWLETGDKEGALEAYKSAQRLLKDSTWPDIALYLSKKLKDPLKLFVLNQTPEFPNIGGLAIEKRNVEPLFDVCAAFEHSVTFVGRELHAQVTLTPLFKGKLSLDWVKITDSLGETLFKHEQKSEKMEAKTLVTSLSDVLVLENGLPLVLEYILNPVQVEDVTFIKLEFQSNELQQAVEINKPGRFWLTQNTINSHSKMHFSPAEDPLYTTVRSRPARIDVIDETLAVVAIKENVQYNFKLISHEEEDVEASYEVFIFDQSVRKGTLKLLADGTPNFVTGELVAPKQSFQISFDLKFETKRDSIPVSMEFVKDVDVVVPFRANFSLKPIHLDQDWPAIFAPTLVVSEIKRKWCLHTSILSMIQEMNIFLESAILRIKSEAAEFEIDLSDQPIKKEVEHNTIAGVTHYFFTQNSDNAENEEPETVEAFAYLDLKWRRQFSDSVNIYTFAPVRLNLPAFETRVLVTAKVVNENISVTYHIENSTPSLLSVSVSMASSTFFAFQGPNLLALRILPFSTHALNYQLLPLGVGSVQNRRPLPELRVFNKSTKRTIVPIPGCSEIVVDQGTLFIHL